MEGRLTHSDLAASPFPSPLPLHHAQVATAPRERSAPLARPHTPAPPGKRGRDRLPGRRALLRRSADGSVWRARLWRRARLLHCFRLTALPTAPLSGRAGGDPRGRAQVL